jgi:branched-chain amino acid transport system substrate-binding protein
MKHCKALLTLLILVSFLSTACRGKTSSQAEAACSIKVGIITSQTGTHSAAGQEQMRGYEIALDEIKATGGIAGCQVELLVKDDASSPQQGQLAVKELTEQDGVPIIIGAFSSSITMPIAGVANVYKIPFLVPTASSDLITTQGYEWVFRINAPSTEYANTALEFAASLQDEKAIDTLAVIYDDSLFGESAAVAAAMGASKRGLRVVAYEVYKAGADDYTPLLSRVKEADPDAVYLASYLKEAILLLQQSEALALNPKLHLGNAGGFVMPEFLMAGKHAEYIVATSQWAPDVSWPGAAEFAQEFAERYGVAPGMRSAETYTALYVVKDAIERAGEQEALDWTDIAKVRLAIRDALKSTNLAETIFGPIRFDRNGQTPHPVVLVQVIDGQFVSVYPEEYRACAPIVPVPSWAER